MFKFLRFLFRTFVVLYRIYQWILRQKRKIRSWFAGSTANHGHQGHKTTISRPSTHKKKRKVFGKDEGHYVDYEEM